MRVLVLFAHPLENFHGPPMSGCRPAHDLRRADALADFSDWDRVGAANICAKCAIMSDVDDDERGTDGS
jgi:hypothetical protein